MKFHCEIRKIPIILNMNFIYIHNFLRTKYFLKMNITLVPKDLQVKYTPKYDSSCFRFSE